VAFTNQKYDAETASLVLTYRRMPTGKAAAVSQAVPSNQGSPARQVRAIGNASMPQNGFELVFDELGKAGTGGLLGLGEEGLGVLLHQAVQRGLLGAVALAVHRGAIAGRPSGLPGHGFPRAGPGSLGWCSFSGRAERRICL